MHEHEEARRQQMRAEAAKARRAIGVILALPGMLDPQERDLLETAQAVVEGFER